MAHRTFTVLAYLNNIQVGQRSIFTTLDKLERVVREFDFQHAFDRLVIWADGQQVMEVKL